MNFNDAMHNVLETRRYDRLMGRGSGVQEALSERIERIFLTFLNRVGLLEIDGGGEAGMLATVFTVVGVIFGLVALVAVLRLLLRRRRSWSRDLSDIFEELESRPYTVADLLSMSQRAPTRREAVRFRYIAALLAMNERGVIAISPSATNAIIARQLTEAEPHMTAYFVRMAEVYHLAWFGHKDIADEVFTRFAADMQWLVLAGAGAEVAHA